MSAEIRPGIRRLLRFITPRSAARDADDEIRLHLKLRTEQLIAEGMSPAAAHEEAERRFGEIDDERREFRNAARRRERRTRWRDWLDATARRRSLCIPNTSSRRRLHGIRGRHRRTRHRRQRDGVQSRRRRRAAADAVPRSVAPRVDSKHRRQRQGRMASSGRAFPRRRRAESIARGHGRLLRLL